MSVTFDSALPEKLYSKFVVDFTMELEALELKRQTGNQAFAFDSASGRVINVADDYGPATFVSHDGVNELFLVPNAVTFTTQRYVRWATFQNSFHAITASILARYDSAVNLNSVRLEYWDRFIWTGEWSDLELEKLLRKDTEVLTQKIFAAQREAHCHTGWFDYADTERRLFNVNVDVLALGMPHNPTRLDPSVGIYILIQDQSDVENTKKFAGVNLMDRLEELHVVSKKQMASLLQPGIAKRIGLGG